MVVAYGAIRGEVGQGTRFSGRQARREWAGGSSFTRRRKTKGGCSGTHPLTSALARAWGQSADATLHSTEPPTTTHRCEKLHLGVQPFHPAHQAFHRVAERFCPKSHASRDFEGEFLAPASGFLPGPYLCENLLRLSQDGKQRKKNGAQIKTNCRTLVNIGSIPRATSPFSVLREVGAI